LEPRIELISFSNPNTSVEVRTKEDCLISGFEQRVNMNVTTFIVVGKFAVRVTLQAKYVNILLLRRYVPTISYLTRLAMIIVNNPAHNS